MPSYELLGVGYGKERRDILPALVELSSGLWRVVSIAGYSPEVAGYSRNVAYTGGKVLRLVVSARESAAPV